MNNISFSKFRELQIKGYTLDIVYLLSLFKENIDVRDMSDSVKINEIVNIIIRKGLLTEEDILTLEGEELLKFIDSPIEDVKIVRKKIDDGEFLKWWSAYPPTNNFTYKGKTFFGDRALKLRKDDCRTKFNKILSKEGYSTELMIEALNYEVIQRKEMSLKTGKNKMDYMHNSYTYLNQCDFDAFIEEINKGNIIKEEGINKFDGINI